MMPDHNEVRGVISEFDLASEDGDRDFWMSLQSDEAFSAAAQRFRDAQTYARHEHATEADAEAREALRRSLREHAQRVRAEVDTRNAHDPAEVDA